MTRQELLLLSLLAAVQFTNILDGMIMMPMAPNIKTSFGIDTQQFGFLVSSYGLAAFVSAVVATFWLDRFDRKNALIALYIGLLTGTYACSTATSYEFFLAARLFTGIFGGVTAAVVLSIIGDVVAPERRAQGMGILMMGFSVASIVGIPLGIFLSEEYSWKMPFFFICSIGIPVLIGLFLFLPPVNGHLKQAVRQSPLDLYRSIYKNGNQLRALGMTAVQVFAHFSIVPYISDYFVNNLGYEMKTELIFVYIVGGALSTISSPLWGRLADKHGRHIVYWGLSVVAIIPIFLISHLSRQPLPVLLAITSAFFIFSGGRMIPLQAMVTSTVEPRQRGGFMSLNAAVQQLSIGLSTLIGGLIIANDAEGHLLHYSTVGYMAIGCTLVGIWLAGKVK